MWKSGAAGLRMYIYGILECWDLAGIHVGSPELLGFNTGWGVMCIFGHHRVFSVAEQAYFVVVVCWDWILIPAIHI